MKNTNLNWNLAEAICNARLIELGYETFLPFKGNSEIDIIAVKEGLVYKIQVKSQIPKKNKISFDLTRKSINYKNVKRIPYKDIDFFLFYDGKNIYKFDYVENVESITFRYTPALNNQIKNIHNIQDYLF